MACPNQPCGDCTELAKLNATKPTSQNILNLIHKRHLIKSNLNSWHDRLATRMPVEIMSRIFIFFDKVNEPGDEEASEMSLCQLDNWDHLLRTPTRLSRVCRRWRHIVLGTPQLWTKYYFNIWMQARNIDLLRQFLSRSGSLPLSMMMWGDQPGDDEELKSISLQLIANLLRSYSSRWQFLDVEFVPEGLTQCLFKNLDYIPPSVLEGLRIDYLHLSEPVPLREPLCPKHIYIQDMQDGGKPRMIPLEWHNITHLEMSNIETNILLDIVKQTPLLTKWISDGVVSSFEDPEDLISPLPIVIPTLKHLELTFKDNNPQFFLYLTLPGLTHLQCHFGDDPTLEENWDFNFDDLIAFLARSEVDSESLQTFDLKYNLIGTDYDHNLVELTALTHLSIHVIDGQNVVTDSYLSEISEISVFPHLRRLHIEVPNIPPSSWATLCNMFRGGRLPVGQDSLGPSGSTLVEPQVEKACLSWQLHECTLDHVSVKVLRHRDIDPPIIPQEDYLFLRKIQEAGVVKLDFKDRLVDTPTDHQIEESDILKNMTFRYKLLELIDEHP